MAKAVEVKEKELDRATVEACLEAAANVSVGNNWEVEGKEKVIAALVLLLKK